MRLLPLLALAGLTALAGCGGKPPPASPGAGVPGGPPPSSAATPAGGDAAKLDGVWKLESIDLGDPELTARKYETDQKIRVVIRGGAMVILTGDKQGIEFEFAPIANTSPVQFRISLAAVLERGGRMTIADMPGAAGKPETAPESGVCKLDGDTLVVAMTLGKDESGPPADFTVVVPKKPGEPGVGVMRLTRTAENPDDVLPASMPATPRTTAGPPPTAPGGKLERFPMTGPATELQGVWTVDSVETGDAELDARGKAANGQIRMVVHGNVLAFARIGFVEVFNFTLDPAATPRKLTLTENRRLSTDPRRGTPEQETAVYKLDGNKLTIATAPGPNPPADLSTPAAGGSVVRLTKADEPPDALLTFVYAKARQPDPPRYPPPTAVTRPYPTGRAYSTYPSRGFATFPARPQTGKN